MVLISWSPQWFHFQRMRRWPRRGRAERAHSIFWQVSLLGRELKLERSMLAQVGMRPRIPRPLMRSRPLMRTGLMAGGELCNVVVSVLI